MCLSPLNSDVRSYQSEKWDDFYPRFLVVIKSFPEGSGKIFFLLNLLNIWKKGRGRSLINREQNRLNAEGKYVLKVINRQ